MKKKKFEELKEKNFQFIPNEKERYMRIQGEKLANSETGQKAYWKILNTVLNKLKVPRISPILFQSRYIIDCREKAKLTFLKSILRSNARLLLRKVPYLNFSTEQTRD